MRNLLVIVSLFFSLNTSAQLVCGSKILGGVDFFPWSQAQPFPWAKIQGLWKVPYDNNTILKVRVLRQNYGVKQLEVEIYSKAESCLQPKMKGLGIIESTEKNVVKIKLENKLIMMALFTPEQLALRPEECGESLMMAISMIDLSRHAERYPFVIESQLDSQNMVLKKVTSSVDLYCKKRN